MKTIVKRLLAAIIVVVIVAAAVISMSQPKYVETFIAVPQTAELYFTEIGDVVAENIVDVYANNSGKLVALYVSENEPINKGDVICQIETIDIENGIKQLESEIEGYRAQIGNLANSEGRDKDSLIVNRNNLVAQLQILEAEKNFSNISMEERQERQAIVIEQNKRVLEDKQKNLDTSQILYDNGALSKSDYDSALLGYENAKAALLQSEKDMVIIQQGDAANFDDYYASRAPL